MCQRIMAHGGVYGCKVTPGAPQPGCKVGGRLRCKVFCHCGGLCSLVANALAARALRAGIVWRCDMGCLAVQNGLFGGAKRPVLLS